MHFDWTHDGANFFVCFAATAVEAVEALTVVLAVGSVRGWTGALAGCCSALIVLLGLVAVLGKALVRLPLHAMQAVIGALLLLLGLRWLRKAILRFAGRIPLRDEEAAFARNVAKVRGTVGIHNWDQVGFFATFQAALLEGLEVVFILLSVSAGRPDRYLSAITGAICALMVVSALGLALHRPLTRIPENTLKFIVAIFLSAFGTFWLGEGLGFRWPAGELSLLVLLAGYFLISVALIRSQRYVNS